MAEQMVLIGCKHPNGVELNLDKVQFIGDPKNGQARVVPGERFVLKGWSYRRGVEIDPTFETGGYRMTPVPASFWEAWLAAHPDFPMLADQTIIGPHKDAVGKARDQAAVPQMFAPSDGKIKGTEPLKKD